jgi:hypothetical protein
MKENTKYAPAVATAKIKWWTLPGAAFVLTRGVFRYFVTGADVRGPGDNATFLHDATEDYRGRPVEKLTRARWRRVLRRWIGLGFPLILLCAYASAAAVRGVSGFFDAEAPGWARLPWGWVLFCYVAAATIAGIVYGGSVIGAWWEAREYRNTYVYPAAKVLARVTGVHMKKKDMLAAIELPPGFGEEISEEPEAVRVYLPEVELTAAMKRRIADAVGARLGLPDAIAKWTESGVPRRFCDLYPQALPPKSVSIESLMSELLLSDMDHPLVGVQTGGRVSRMDFKNDSPHSLGSAGSGAGKSTLYKLIGMQRMRLGAYAIFLDFKKWSHLRWAGKLPGRALIEDEVPAIHNALGRVLDELMWRKSFNLEDESKLAELPTIDVYVEEINTLLPLLVDYWTAYTAEAKVRARIRVRKAKEEIKAAGAEGEAPDHLLAELEEAEEALVQAQSLPKKSPAVQAIRYGVNLGREFRIHFHFIGQSIDAAAAGGRNTRESFRTRLLARWDAKTWKMLADGIPFVACPSGDVGIWAHVHGGEYEIVRVPYVPDEFAIEYVLEGTRPSLPMFHGDPAPSIEGETVRPAIAAIAALSEIVNTLPSKADGGRISLDALRTASKRRAETGFPEPVEEPLPGRAALYAIADVEAWFRDRERIPSLGS